MDLVRLLAARKRGARDSAKISLALSFAAGGMRFLGRRGYLRMPVAITFGDQPEHEGCDNKHGNSFFGSREAESLPHLNQF